MSPNSINDSEEFNRQVERHDAHMIGGKILTYPKPIEDADQPRRMRTGIDDGKRDPIDHMFIANRNYDELHDMQMQLSAYARFVQGMDYSIIEDAREIMQKWMRKAFQSQQGVCIISDFSTGFQGGVFQDVMDLEEQYQAGSRRILLTDKREPETKAACQEYGIDRSSIYAIYKPKSEDVRIQTDGPWMQKLHALFRQ